MLKPVVLITSLVVALGLALAACGGDSGGSSGSPSLLADAPCEDVAAPAPRTVSLDPPPSKPSSDDLTAIVDTSCGTIDIKLDTKNSPKTTASFEYLADQGVLDGIPFHRIVPGFVVQSGDPAGTGSGPGPGYSVDEPPPADQRYLRGTVAMAKTDAEPPGRSGSQFFIVTGTDAGLPPNYAIVGKVIKGMDVAKTIEQYGDPATGQTGTPLGTVLVNSVTIKKG